MNFRSILICAGILTSISASAQNNGGWTNLFNGRDLAGFKQLNGKARYEVKNKEIIGTTVSNEPNSFFGNRKGIRGFYFGAGTVRASGNEFGHSNPEPE